MNEERCALSYMGHRRRGEQACVACLVAWAKRQRAYRQRKETK